MPGFVPNWAGNTASVNVKDYGALGNDSNDDTSAIILAVAAAFGPAGARNGQGHPERNKELYFPPGKYVVTSPINLSDIAGAHIFGAGNGAAQISYKGTGAEGNTLSSENPNLSPIFMIDGVVNATISRLSFTTNAASLVTLTTNGTTATGNNTLHFASTTGVLVGMTVFHKTAPLVINFLVVTAVTGTTVTLSAGVGSPGVGSGDTILFLNNTVGAYLYQSGSNGVTSAIHFEDCNFSSFGQGVVGGSGPGNCDDMQFFNCQFNGCALSGLRTVSGNALNYGVFGGGASNCGTASNWVTGVGGNGAGAYSCVSGSITAIVNVGVTTNFPDFYNAYSQGMAIIGSRSESINCAVLNGGLMAFVGCSFGGGDETKNPSVDLFDSSQGGILTLTSCQFTPNRASFYTNPAYFIRMGNGTQATIDGLVLNDFAKTSITGGGGSSLCMRGVTLVSGANIATLTSSYAGTFTQNNSTLSAITKAGAFTASDVRAGSFVVGRDTSGSTTKLYYNNAGTLMSVALT